MQNYGLFKASFKTFPLKPNNFFKPFSSRDYLKIFCKICKYCFESSEGSNKTQGETYKGT